MPLSTPVKHAGLMELTIQFQTASGDGSTQVSLAPTLSLSSLQHIQQKTHHIHRKQQFPLSCWLSQWNWMPKCRPTLLKHWLYFGLSLNPPSQKRCHQGSITPDQTWYNRDEKSVLLPFIESHEALSLVIAWTRLK